MQKIQKRYFWKGLSYCKNLEEVKISFLFQSLGLDTSERKYIIKKLILGNLKLFDILLLKKQI